MTLFPVVERELRVASRRGWTYWGRTMAAGVGIAIGAWFFVLERRGAPMAFGRALFDCIAFFAFVYALLTGITYSSDSVSVEKREGTLGLLFLTDLRGHDVVLGKLAASSLNVFFRLLAVLPVLAGCLL